ncbi:hypothetical protein IHE45_06G086300 [Dioscorea alata]|uniref:Uncharacterized protein n=1 Tax=Dioscorea alata TaxID=55571 RepID=A0ACB7VYD7_DIOAL|nr:hypothetical protein IHE45_06G086300 [Dioscorea alata]
MAAASLALTVLFLLITTAPSDHGITPATLSPSCLQDWPFSEPSRNSQMLQSFILFLTSDVAIEEKETLGQVLEGGHLVVAPYKIEFLVDLVSEEVEGRGGDQV